MKRVVAAFVVLGVVVLAVLVPALTWDLSSGAQAESEPTRITDYRARFAVSDEGTLEVIEEITVAFPTYPPRRGIFRYFDRADANAPQQRRDPRDIDVRMDGEPVGMALSEESNGRYEVVRIGSEDVVVAPGRHTYRIAYAIDDVLLRDEQGLARLRWNLVPGGWRQAIDRTRLEVSLPAAAVGTACDVGWGGTGGCTVRGDGGTTLVVTTGPLEPFTPVTIDTGVDMAIDQPPRDRWWSSRWDSVLGPSLPLLALVLLASMVAGWIGARAARSTLETPPGLPLQYAPPPGIGPAQGMQILRETVDRKAFIATLLEGAQLGAWRMESKPGSAWAVEDTGDDQSWGGLDPVTRQTGQVLGLRTNKVFHVGRKDVAAGELLKSAQSASSSAARAWALSQGHLVKSGLGLAAFLVVLSIVAALVLALVNPLDMSVLGLVPGAFGAFGLWLVLPGANTRRTPSGRDLWARLGGFERVLSTPSSQE
ncbi:MAG: DUF2207 domain-containing protein, partial [Nocardioides sp.]|nr:DUF2207 domain-containing protein [Nocardioides sp.]